MRPFHMYSMRQAIEEGFILDVLANYITYRTYWKLSNANPDDREVDQRKAAAQLARFAALHATSLGQRRRSSSSTSATTSAARLGGRAKAMVVTSSRDHAVRLYRQARRLHRDNRGYDRLRRAGRVLRRAGVAGIDDDTVTEAGINGFAEGELPRRFGYTRADDPHAETTRSPSTGSWSSPRSTRPASTSRCSHDVRRQEAAGRRAVQTLSRLNRTRPGKSQDDLSSSTSPTRPRTSRRRSSPTTRRPTTEPTDPNLLYAAQRQVMDFALLVESEMESFAVAYLAAEGAARTDAQWQRAHADLYRHTEPARDRFAQLLADDPGRAEEFRGALQDYVRKYGFLSQVVSYHDRELERLYVYGRLLLTRLDRREDPGVDLGEVDLTHLRITRTGEHDVSLSPEGEQVLPGFTGDGAGRRNEPEQVSLSELIADLNDRFGVNLSDDDLVGGSARAAMGDPRVKAAAAVNSETDFAHVFDGVFEDKLIERIEDDTKVLQKFSDDVTFKSELTQMARRYAYEALRRDVA